VYLPRHLGESPLELRFLMSYGIVPTPASASALAKWQSSRIRCPEMRLGRPSRTFRSDENSPCTPWHRSPRRASRVGCSSCKSAFSLLVNPEPSQARRPHAGVKVASVFSCPPILSIEVELTCLLTLQLPVLLRPESTRITLDQVGTFDILASFEAEVYTASTGVP
jgi:hypothetical protein